MHGQESKLDELLTLREAAEYLKVNERTIRRWIAEGRLAAAKISRTVRIRRDALDVLTKTGISEGRVRYLAPASQAKKDRREAEGGREPADPATSHEPDLARQTLVEAELHRMVTVLVERYEPQQIILFGSAAQHNVRAWSDLDLFIVKVTDKRFVQRSIEVARLVQPRVAVDFIVYTPAELAVAISEKRHFIVEEVLGKGRVLYASEGAPTHA